MSRILGRANDVLTVSESLCKANIPKYQKDFSRSTWEEVEGVKDDLKIYLPSIAVDFIDKEKISILRNPFRLYTFVNVPEYEDEKRFIRFPSLQAKKEYEREYAFGIGLLLSSYHVDTQDEFLEIGKEYDDIIPLLLDYIYMKHNGIEDRYALKFLRFLKVFSRKYASSYKEYDKFSDFAFNANTYKYSENVLKRFDKLVTNYDDDFEAYVMKHLLKLSSFDGALQVIDKNYSDEELKKLLEELIENPNYNRASILYERGIESFGHKRLLKEIEKYQKK